MRVLKWIVAAVAMAMTISCANTVTLPAARESLRFVIELAGNIDVSQTRLYLVLDTLPGPHGPRIYGPWRIDRPKLGWDLPFYLSGAEDPANPNTDPFATQTWQGNIQILPVRWTDYFVLHTEAGILKLDHGQRPAVLTDPPNPNLIVPNVRNLQQGQDWFLEGNRITLIIPKSTLVGGPDFGGQSSIKFNLVTSNLEGRPIDTWNVGPNEFPSPLSIVFGTAQARDSQLGRPLPFPQNKPATIPDAGVDLQSYVAEVRR